MNELTNKMFSAMNEGIDWNWDGKKSTYYLKEETTHWRQMEWMGFYWEHIGPKAISNKLNIKTPGPKYGNVEIDAFLEIPWDYKTHSINSEKGGTNKDIPTNGYQEVLQCLEEHKRIGFIIASGISEFDSRPEMPFKQWHDKLKGAESDYVKKGKESGRRQRARKVNFNVKSVDFIILDKNTINLCGRFQEGMINSDGTPRNAKVNLPYYKIMNDIIPEIEKYSYKVTN